MGKKDASGTLALIGGGEWLGGGEDFDRELLTRVDNSEVVVLPTAAAYEHPDRVVKKAEDYFDRLGTKVKPLMVLNRREAEDSEVAEVVKRTRFIYLSDGSPLHLRSVLKDSLLWESIVEVLNNGGVLAASGAAATLVCDPMVDPRGGAYTVGLGLVSNLAVFPYHGTAADHMRDRSIDLLAPKATLVGVDEQTALIRDATGWRVAGAGAVTLYEGTQAKIYSPGSVLPDFV